MGQADLQSATREDSEVGCELTNANLRGFPLYLLSFSRWDCAAKATRYKFARSAPCEKVKRSGDPVPSVVDDIELDRILFLSPTVAWSTCFILCKTDGFFF